MASTVGDEMRSAGEVVRRLEQVAWYTARSCCCRGTLFDEQKLPDPAASTRADLWERCVRARSKVQKDEFRDDLVHRRIGQGRRSAGPIRIWCDATLLLQTMFQSSAHRHSGSMSKMLG